MTRLPRSAPPRRLAALFLALGLGLMLALAPASAQAQSPLDQAEDAARNEAQDLINDAERGMFDGLGDWFTDTAGAVRRFFDGDDSGNGSERDSVNSAVQNDFETKCLLCGFVGGYIQIADNFAKKTFELLAPELRKVMIYVFMLWVLVKGAHLMLGWGNAGDIFWTLVRRSALFFVIMALLVAGTKTSGYWSVFYETPLRIATATSDEIMNIASLQDKPDKCGNFRPIANLSTPHPIDIVTVERIVCQVERTEQLNRFGIQTGWRIMTNPSTRGFLDFVGSIVGIIGGLFLIVVFGLSVVYFAFFFMDLFTRVAILSALAPIWIACFFLDYTRQWTQKVFLGIVETAFTVLAASAVYGFVSTLMAAVPVVMAESASVKELLTENPSLRAKLGSSGPQTMEDVFFLIENNAPFTPLDQHFWYVIIAGLMTLMLTRKIVALMQSIFGGAGGGSTMADTALGVAGTLGTLGARVGMGAVGAVGGGLANVGKTFGGGALTGMAPGLANTLGNLKGITGRSGEAFGRGIAGGMGRMKNWIGGLNGTWRS